MKNSRRLNTIIRQYNGEIQIFNKNRNETSFLIILNHKANLDIMYLFNKTFIKFNLNVRFCSFEIS